MADKYFNAAGLSALKAWILSKIPIIDAAMSDTSTNSVQNMIIKSYIDDHAQMHDDDIAALNVAIGDIEARLLALEGKDVPDEYIKISALKASGNAAYIDTGLTLDGSLSVSIEGRTETDSAAVLFDAYRDSNLRMGGVFYNRARPRYDRWWTGVTYAEHQTTGIDLSQKFLLQQTRTGISITQGSVTTASAYNGTTETDDTIPVWLFKTSRTGVSSGDTIIYSARFEKAGELLRNLVPVKRVADDALGMYDKVTKVFFGNAGSGAFTIA